MNAQELADILTLHQKWLDDPSTGRRANLRGADLWSADLWSADLCGADLCGANLDYACWPLWCGSLSVQIDDRIAVQLLYHLLSTVQCSPDVSDELKNVLLTPALIDAANHFHRADKCGKNRSALASGNSTKAHTIIIHSKNTPKRRICQ